MKKGKGSCLGCRRGKAGGGGNCTFEESLEPGDNATLAQLTPGQKGIVTGVGKALRCAQKFADIGMIKGTQVLVEAWAPFGGLLRVRLLDSSMAMHFQEARHIMVRVEK